MSKRPVSLSMKALMLGIAVGFRVSLAGACDQTATRWPLGAFLNNPNAWNKNDQSQFDRTLHSFQSLMGVAPSFIDTAVDYTVPISRWVENASAQAQSNARSTVKSASPVIAVPMYSVASGANSPDDQFQAFASGEYDTVLSGIVTAYAAQGFKEQYIRLGWEMNIAHTPTYVGDDYKAQADWVKAFRHIYRILHAAAAKNGVLLRVIWNPGLTPYSAAVATTALYPGDDYVDVIGADVYSDLGPYRDDVGYHDWRTNREVLTKEEFMAEPINRIHYWNHPAATRWTQDASNGHALSLADIIGFAIARKKTLAIPETGAGNSDDHRDVKDDPEFPRWLAEELKYGQKKGLRIAFVILYDSKIGGNWGFSNPEDEKPIEAKAWAKYFGVGSSCIK